MFNTKNQHASLWDKKAKQYTRFSRNLDTFEQRVLSLVAQRGIDFSHKRILDIGCGTGIYTLHIAKEAHHVNALDFSSEMLTILQEDALKEGLIDKLSFTCNTWSDFTHDEPFDILFSSMSPALQKESDFLKMHTLAKEACVYLGWGGKRTSSLLDPLFVAHHKALKVPYASTPLKLWLEKESIPYVCDYLEEKRVNEKTYEEALESVLWHFEMDNIVPNHALIESIMHPMKKANGCIDVETHIGVELISWKK